MIQYQAKVPFKLTNMFIKALGEKPVGKRLMIVRDVYTAIYLAIDNSVTFVTDDLEAKALFERNVIGNGQFGNDDDVVFIDITEKKMKEAWLEGINRASTDMKFDIIIGNPPYNEPKPEGKKRTAPRLDNKIFKLCQQQCSNSHLVFIMGSACSQMKNMKYTWMSDNFAFPGDVAITVNLFEYKPGDKILDIKTKYELNGKRDWLKHNALPLEESICSLINVNGSKQDVLQDTVQPNYFFYNERSYTGIHTYLPGDSVLKKNGKRKVCLDYIKCKNIEQLKKLDNYFKTYIAEKFKTFIKFGDGHLNRGFLRTIPLPDFMK